MLFWTAPQEVLELADSIRTHHHLPRLEEASIAVSFSDRKPFIGGRFNWGKTSKFSPSAKIWQHKKYDFHISLPADTWHSLLDGNQREAWLDLHLTRCTVEYVPATVLENGKKIPRKDEFGRIEYTNEIKRDDEGFPKWKILPLDLFVFQENVSRFGCWCRDLTEFQQILVSK